MSQVRATPTLRENQTITSSEGEDEIQNGARSIETQAVTDEDSEEERTFAYEEDMGQIKDDSNVLRPELFEVDGSIHPVVQRWP